MQSQMKIGVDPAKLAFVAATGGKRRASLLRVRLGLTRFSDTQRAPNAFPLAGFFFKPNHKRFGQSMRVTPTLPNGAQHC